MMFLRVYFTQIDNVEYLEISGMLGAVVFTCPDYCYFKGGIDGAVPGRGDNKMEAG